MPNRTGEDGDTDPVEWLMLAIVLAGAIILFTNPSIATFSNYNDLIEPIRPLSQFGNLGQIVGLAAIILGGGGVYKRLR